MTTSSVLEDYLTKLHDIENDTITITSSSGTPTTYSYLTSLTATTVSGSTLTINGTNASSWSNVSIDSTFKWSASEEWVDCFPDFDRIQSMCEEYPGLKIVFEKFKTTYLLVKNHYDTPEDQRPKP
jgi:hypothetical protein